MKACFVGKDGSDRLDFVYKMGRREKFEAELEVLPGVVTEKNLEQNRDFLRETEVIITTWQMLPLTGEEIDRYFPRLQLVLYGAGSVQYFARPFLERGIKIVSSWGAMAISVMEYAVSLILLSNKGFFPCLLAYKTGGYANAQKAHRQYPGSYETKVGLLGAGMIGSAVAKRLGLSNIEVLVFDPFMDEAKAESLGVKKVSIEEVFSSCQTVSNHLANNKQTEGMLNYRLFSLMKDNGTFINSGRGATVVEADLVRALKEKPDRTAILDVTYPEPVPAGHEFLTMPNVYLTPHIAGVANNETLRFTDFMLEELRRFKTGKKLLYEVTLPMLETMA
jgi:phosphoglycerate dehydrogenase-like enzyme